MAYSAEDLVRVLNETSSPFGLTGDLAQFQQGLANLVARVRRLEAAQAKPAAMPQTKGPGQ